MTIDSIFYLIWTGLLVFVFVSWIKSIKAKHDEQISDLQQQIKQLKLEVRRNNTSSRR